MPEYEVNVEKRMYCTGVVKVNAINPDEAEEKVMNQISTGELQTTAVEWDDLEYEDGSFNTTGDVD